MDRLRIECVAQVAHFVKDTTESPDVTFVAVGLCLEELGGHVVGRTDAGICEILRVVEHTCNTKIAKSYLLVQ